jgi:hypothetical protein
VTGRDGPVAGPSRFCNKWSLGGCVGPLRRSLRSMSDARGAKRSKPHALSPPGQHKRPGGAYVAEIVSLDELLRFVHCNGAGGVAVEWVASRQLGVITVAQRDDEPVYVAAVIARAYDRLSRARG